METDADNFIIASKFDALDLYTRRHPPVVRTSAYFHDFSRKYFSLKSARENEEVCQIPYRERL